METSLSSHIHRTNFFDRYCMYKTFITKLVSEVNRDMDNINTMIKLGVMVYRLIFLLLDGPANKPTITITQCTVWSSKMCILGRMVVWKICPVVF